MIKLVKKLLLCTIATLVVFAGVKFYTIKNRVKNYNSAFVDKLKILAKNKQNKKIILLGGSSVGFGISAQMMQKQTGIKTINLGQHFGFGLTDAQDFILKNLTKNDIILFSPEWFFYSNPVYYDKATLDNLIVNNLDYGILLGNPLHVLQSVFSPIALRDFSSASKDAGRAEDSSVYVYHCINGFGDIVAQCHLPSQKVVWAPVEPQTFDFEKFLRAFPFITSPRTIIVFPPTASGIFRNEESYFKKIEMVLRAKKINVLNSVDDNVYPESCFFDNEYHLNCDTRVIRTTTILKDLNRLFTTISDESH
jgi:hypothetical protein